MKGCFMFLELYLMCLCFSHLFTLALLSFNFFLIIICLFIFLPIVSHDDCPLGQSSSSCLLFPLGWVPVFFITCWFFVLLRQKVRVLITDQLSAVTTKLAKGFSMGFQGGSGQSPNDPAMGKQGVLGITCLCALLLSFHSTFCCLGSYVCCSESNPSYTFPGKHFWNPPPYCAHIHSLVFRNIH